MFDKKMRQEDRYYILEFIYDVFVEKYVLRRYTVLTPCGKIVVVGEN
ncbi:MAG: hypothetical protein N4A57_09890 [Anaeromicrobium sp.]|nr:hypothetical protein [Anaeromicrobium sp.]MCT4594560.1 hypothetical protein [Anaeromicrobium sp.]